MDPVTIGAALIAATQVFAVFRKLGIRERRDKADVELKLSDGSIVPLEVNGVTLRRSELRDLLEKLASEPNPDARTPKKVP